jgi:predicted Fe-Mo cluster-binding NifX family protein
MVKIAVSSISPGGLDALIDHRFGRCEFFTIIEAENNQIK